MILFISYTKWTKLINAVRSQDSGCPWGDVVGTLKGQEGSSSWLGSYYTDVFSLSELIEPCAYCPHVF